MHSALRWDNCSSVLHAPQSPVGKSRSATAARGFEAAKSETKVEYLREIALGNGPAYLAGLEEFADRRDS
jgi:hypothetical protein